MTGTSPPVGLALMRGAVHTARRVAGDPRTRDVMASGPRALAYLLQQQRRESAPDDDPALLRSRPSLGLALSVWLDEVTIAALRHPSLLPQPADFPAAAADVAAASRFYRERGWIDDPASYHHDPSPPDDARLSRERVLDMSYEHVSFDSGWEPEPGEPRRAEWLDHRDNRTMHAWLLRREASAPWLICVHGFGMGRPLMDLRGLRAGRFRTSGLNVAMPVLPLHGPRADGPVRGEGFMTLNLVDAKHGLAQAAWDIRRLIRWLRAEQGAERIALYGLSLGGCVVALTAALEAELDAVIAGIPVVDLPELYRHHSPAWVRRDAARHQVLGEAALDVHRLVSPLAMPCQVPYEGRFIVGGAGDRMSTFDQSRRLWSHWEKPAIACYSGGHIGYFWSTVAARFVKDSLTSIGFVTATQGHARSS